MNLLVCEVPRDTSELIIVNTEEPVSILNMLMVFKEEGGVGWLVGGEEEGRGKERRGREEGREGGRRTEERDEKDCWRDGGGVSIVFRLLSQHLRLGSPALKAPP